MRFHAVSCWEANDVTSPVIPAVRRLYEETLSPDERIPWEWIERSIEGRGRADGWRKHLLLAAPKGLEADPDALAGYAFGSFLPGYAGYLCYLGVADRARRLGVGTCLLEAFFQRMAEDAKQAGESIPFVIWESHRPGPDASPAEQSIWSARVRLFDRVGGLWAQGVDFLSPNFAEDEGEPIPLQVFLKPMDEPIESFDESRVRAAIEQLHQRVYRLKPGDDLYDRTFPPGCRTRLTAAALADECLVFSV